MYVQLFVSRHIELSHNWEKRVLPCPIPNCDKYFQARRGLLTHAAHMHTKDERDQYMKLDADGNYEEGSTVKGSRRRFQPVQTFWRKIYAQRIQNKKERAKQKKMKMTG